jgi:hypothetical protein
MHREVKMRVLEKLLDMNLDVESKITHRNIAII